MQDRKCCQVLKNLIARAVNRDSSSDFLKGLKKIELQPHMSISLIGSCYKEGLRDLAGEPLKQVGIVV